MPCASCAGLGHGHECTTCSSSGEIECPACFGTGLFPSSHLMNHAELGAVAHLLDRLPQVDDDAPGELVDRTAAVHRITSFLAIYHWAPSENPQDKEHQMFVLQDRLHLQVAILSSRAAVAIRIDYRFLTISRTGPRAFRLRYAEELKLFR